MTTLVRRLKRALHGLASAEVDEESPTQEQTDPPAAESLPEESPAARPPVAGSGKSRRKVAVNLGPGLNRTQLDYAVGITQRLDAELVLLRHPSGAEDEICDQWIDSLRQSQVAFQTEQLDGRWIDAVGDYLRSHGEVDFLVLAPDDLPRQGEVSGKTANAQLRFPVPLVVVENRDAIVEGEG